MVYLWYIQCLYLTLLSGQPVTVQFHQPEGLLQFIITAQTHPWAMEAIATVTRTDNRENMCGQGWKLYSGKCYILVKIENPTTFIQDICNGKISVDI